jgi:hypothetical protein
MKRSGVHVFITNRLPTHGLSYAVKAKPQNRFAILRPARRPGTEYAILLRKIAGLRCARGLQRKSFFAVCGKKDWSGKPGFFARLRAKKCAQIPNYKWLLEQALW